MSARRASMAVALIASFAAESFPGVRSAPRDPDPERQAAAQAKRDRKAAKRRAEAAKHRRAT